jgi:RNA polymerase sigma factor (sigma-70 family)
VATRTSEVRDSGAEVARLYGEYGAQIQRFCLGRLRSREDAEDATQNTFLRAYAALRRGVVPELESAWLFKIARNVCLSRRLAGSRRSRVETPHDLQAMQDWIPAPGDDHDELIRLDEALATLPERLQRAILLREWQGLSYSEIALELGISLSAVETLIFRARRQLAQALENTVTKPARRLKQALNLGPLLGTLKGLLGATGAANLTAGAAAVAVLTVGGLEAGGIHAIPSGGSNRGSTTPATTPAPVVASPAVHTQRSGTKSSVAARPRPVGSASGARVVVRGATRRRAPVTQAAAASSVPAPGALLGVPAGGGSDPGPAAAASSAGTPGTAAQPQLQPAQPKVSASTGPGTGPIGRLPSPPAVTTPVVTVPPVTTPAVTTPVVTVPPVTTPAVTTPVVTVPPVTTPAVTTPAVTTPAVTTPAVTTPAVTVPPVTAPSTPVPSTPAPSVSVPVPSVPAPTATVAVPPPPTVAVPSVPPPPVSVPVPPPAPPAQPSVPAVTLPQVP